MLPALRLKRPLHHFNACSPWIHFDLSEGVNYSNYMSAIILAVSESADHASKLAAQIGVWVAFAAIFAKFFQMVFRRKPKSKE
jgi:hypothetical protein